MNSQEKPWGHFWRRAIGWIVIGIDGGAVEAGQRCTIDEVAHIGAGVSYLQKLDQRMNPEHPPLLKVLAALPLVCRGDKRLASAA